MGQIQNMRSEKGFLKGRNLKVKKGSETVAVPGFCGTKCTSLIQTEYATDVRLEIISSCQ